ncbi:MAG: NAD-dependent epimerase/dehydratase family protein [Candidatus Odinarchaeia archaeon]
MKLNLVIGGAGFIGSNLVLKLVSSGEKVDVIDNMMTGNINNLRDVIDKVNVFTDKIKDFNPEKLPEYDIIYYFGIPSSSPMYKENPTLLSTTVNEAVYILETLRKSQFKGRIVLSSTSSIYNGNPLPYKEDMAVKVTDYYTECRYYIERLLELYSNLYNIKSIALRFFSVYGPKEEYKGKYANIVTQFLWNYLKKEKPIIYGDGTQTRDFIFVDDIVEACVLASEINSEFEILNLGTGIETSFNQVIEALNENFNTEVEPVYVKNPITNYVKRTLADTSKLIKVLGYKPKIKLKEGIEIIRKYYSAII